MPFIRTDWLSVSRLVDQRLLRGTELALELPHYDGHQKTPLAALTDKRSKLGYHKSVNRYEQLHSVPAPQLIMAHKSTEVHKSNNFIVSAARTRSRALIMELKSCPQSDPQTPERLRSKQAWHHSYTLSWHSMTCLLYCL